MRKLFWLLLAIAITGCATRPTASVVEVPSQITPALAQGLAQIGPVVAPPPTEKLYAPLAQREPYAGVQARRDVRYGADARNLLDVFTPATQQASKPVLVYVHGGGFMRGERRTGDSPFYDNIMLWAVRQGMVGVNMTYRLAPANPWPAAQQDIQSALKWVRENIAASGGDPNRIILMGHSAGAAHVAQYVAHPQFHVTPGSGLAGAVLLSGIFDPVTADAGPPLQAYFGIDTAQYPARSAVPGLVASKVPLLIVYADRDPQDFHRQSGHLNTALCNAGRCQGLYKLMGHSHMSEVYSINSADTTVTNLIKQWVDRLR